MYKVESYVHRQDDLVASEVASMRKEWTNA